MCEKAALLIHAHVYISIYDFCMNGGISLSSSGCMSRLFRNDMSSVGTGKYMRHTIALGKKNIYSACKRVETASLFSGMNAYLR